MVKQPYVVTHSLVCIHIHAYIHITFKFWKNADKIFEKAEGMIPLGRPGRKWEDIKMDLT
jgi:hypothetical protein